MLKQKYIGDEVKRSLPLKLGIFGPNLTWVIATFVLFLLDI
jgi:hypothetical protein